MRMLFVIDPPARLNPRKDSTIALMRAAARAGDDIFAATPVDLSMSGGDAVATARQLQVSEEHTPWFVADDAKKFRAEDFDMVLMRAEPPVDSRFIAATWVLDAFSSPVVNAPRALREMNEKLAILRFPQFIAPTIVSADMDEIAAFCDEHDGAVIKPLHGMGGRGVYVSPKSDMNLRSVVELVGNGDMIMAQRYIPAAREGDARVFVIDGKPAEHMLMRVPRADDHRGNMAAGGRAEARPIGGSARAIAEVVGPVLADAGVWFAGLDVIGDYLTEINITCPTGLREVRDQTGDDLAESAIAALRRSIT